MRFPQALQGNSDAQGNTGQDYPAKGHRGQRAEFEVRNDLRVDDKCEGKYQQEYRAIASAGKVPARYARRGGFARKRTHHAWETLAMRRQTRNKSAHSARKGFSILRPRGNSR